MTDKPMAAGNVERQALYDQLMSTGRATANTQALACMLATHHGGGGSLPRELGLEAEDFARMMEHHFPGARLPACGPRTATVWDPRLAEERGELIKLLQLHRAGQEISETWIGTIVASGCMASDHLWQDLGLWSRRDLSALMIRNFPTLAAKNDRDMRWKKFLYKQLCEQEGIYLCRAPSCAQCVDYPLCFNPEE